MQEGGHLDSSDEDESTLNTSQEQEGQERRTETFEEVVSTSWDLLFNIYAFVIIVSSIQKKVQRFCYRDCSLYILNDCFCSIINGCNIGLEC